MSTDQMRKLMMLAETMDGVCPHCHGWGEYIDPEGFDEPVHCPHCDEDDEPIRKSRLVKDMAMDMDMDWTDLGLSDVEPEDLKGFPKVNESFTRKHFQMIADTVKKIEDPEVRRQQAEDYADAFAMANPRFRRDLFMKAAGVEDLNEEQSEFRLAEIVGKDNFAELVSDLNAGGIDYNAAYFQPLYWYFLDEYPDEIPVGSRTGRPEDPEEYVLDNLERYHGEEIKQYTNTPDMDEGLSEDEDDGDVLSRRVSDEELLAKVKEKIDATLKYLSIGMEAESGNGDAKLLAIQLRRQLKELKALIESGSEALEVRSKLHLAFVKAEKLADYSYEFDDVLWELNDADNLLYLHLSGRPVAIDESEDKGKPYICVHAKKGKHECYADTSYGAAKKAAEHWGLKSTAGIDAHLAIDEASCPCGKEGCECGPDCDCEPIEEGGEEVKGVNDKYDDKLNCKHCGDYFCTSKFGGDCPEIQMDMFGEIELDEIVESILNERGMPKDYEMSDEELAAEIEDETSEFERDHIDKEIEDEELGLRFD